MGLLPILFLLFHSCKKLKFLCSGTQPDLKEMMEFTNLKKDDRMTITHSVCKEFNEELPEDQKLSPLQVYQAFLLLNERIKLDPGDIYSQHILSRAYVHKIRMEAEERMKVQNNDMTVNEGGSADAASEDYERVNDDETDELGKHLTEHEKTEIFKANRITT